MLIPYHLFQISDWTKTILDNVDGKYLLIAERARTSHEGNKLIGALTVSALARCTASMYSRAYVGTVRYSRGG